MKALLFGFCALVLATCTHSPSADPLQSDDDVRSNGSEAIEGLNKQDSLVNVTQPADTFQLDLSEEGVDSCIDFKEFAVESWRDDTLGTLILWESDIASFESFVEEAQCMVGRPWTELEAILGTDYFKPNSKYEAQMYGSRYYHIQLNVLTPEKYKPGILYRLKLYVKTEKETDATLEINFPSLSKSYRGDPD